MGNFKLLTEVELQEIEGGSWLKKLVNKVGNSINNFITSTVDSAARLVYRAIGIPYIR